MLRIYMRKYALGNAYGYDLAAIRDHITWYHEMIDVLAEKLPDIARVVHYEDIVADPRAALGVAAELCGLPMEHGPLPEYRRRSRVRGALSGFHGRGADEVSVAARLNPLRLLPDPRSSRAPLSGPSSTRRADPTRAWRFG